MDELTPTQRQHSDENFGESVRLNGGQPVVLRSIECIFVVSLIFSAYIFLHQIIASHSSDLTIFEPCLLIFISRCLIGFIYLLEQYDLTTYYALISFVTGAGLLYYALIYQKDPQQKGIISAFGSTLVGFALGIQVAHWNRGNKKN